MSAQESAPCNRILVVDDNRAIHDDFRKILTPWNSTVALDEAEALLFGGSTPAANQQVCVEIESAFQGEEGVAMVQRAAQEGQHYAMAFVDVRMPPGLDGVETATRIWKIDPGLPVMFCTAHSDYSREEMMARIDQSHRMTILKKPFEPAEVLRLVSTMVKKSQQRRQSIETSR